MTVKDDRPSERPLFDHYAKSYAQEVDRAIAFSGQGVDFFAQTKVDLLCDLVARTLGDPAGLKVIDVGCGPGLIHRKLADAGMVVTGVDVAGGPIATARAANPFAHYEVMDGLTLPFGDGVFDLAIAVCVLHHVPESDRQGLVSEMCRVTRRGGLVALIEHNPLNPLTRYAVWRCPFDEDSVLLPASQSRALLHATAGKAKTRHFLFFPLRHRWVSTVERRLAWLGLGGQYCVYAVNGSIGATG